MTGATVSGAGLPAGLEPPLRLLEEAAGGPRWGLVFGLLLAALLIAMVVRRLRRRPADAPPPAPRATPPPPVDDPGDAIRELGERIAEEGAWRRGCHELAALVRRRAERLLGVECTVRTVRELERDLPDHALPQVMDLLANLQFRREEPGRDDFETASELSVAVLRQLPSRRSR